MIALALYIGVFAAVIGGVVWVVDRGGSVVLVWDNWELSTTTTVLLAAVALVAIVAVFTVNLFMWFWRSPGRIRQVVGSRRREKGYLALAAGLVSVAAGDVREARRNAKRADRFLDNPPLTLLLSAQAAQLDGDYDEAQLRFKEMLEQPETEFLGLRGLAAVSIHKGEYDDAAVYSRRAHALRPDASWAAESVFRLQAVDGDWEGAQLTLRSERDRKIISAQSGQRRQAILLIEQARAALERNDRTEARKLARKAHRIASDLVPATAFLSRILVEDGDMRAARNAIEKTWQSQPHPELADTYLSSFPLVARTRHEAANRLMRAAPHSFESRLIAARVSLDHELAGEARRLLKSIELDELPARVCHLWAEVENKSGNHEEADRWKKQGATASDETWHCKQCGAASETWHAVCASCRGFDTFRWGKPGRVKAVEPAGSAIVAPDSRVPVPSDSLLT